MEEKKVVIPPPPKELKNMPPPPPPRPLPPKPVQVEEAKPIVEQQIETNVNSQEDVPEEPKVELTEQTTGNIENSKKAKKSSGGVKTILYWCGFVLSLVAIGVVIYLLIK